MEEPPKIERIISSQGISLSDTASILNTYLSNIEHYQYGGAAAAATDALLGNHERSLSPVPPPSTTEGGVSEEDPNGNKRTPHNKSRQEREEEALIAQMVASSSTSSTGRMISDDIYERLKLIAQSMCAEVEGKPMSASRMMNGNALVENGVGGGGDDPADMDDTTGAEDFLAELDEANRLEQEEEQKRQEKLLQPQNASQLKKDKKKEKKAKKAAKKAKKEAKRKSMEG